MTSAAKIAANQRNALKSTGPRSVTGKMRSRRNAYRHGLSIPISTDIAFAGQIETLANDLAQNASQPNQCEAARRAASAHLEHERAHGAKVRTINRATQDLQEQKRCEAEHGPALAFASQVKVLVTIDSYERGALAKRNRALRVLDALTHVAYPKTAASRQCHLFDRPVWAFNINALVNAVFESTPHASGGTWDCPQIEDLRVTVQMQNGQSGIIQFTFAERTSSTQEFAIAKTGRHGGRQWIANCPKTGKRIEDLYLEKDQHSIGSRYMLGLSYCSSKSDQAPAARQVSLQRIIEPSEGTPTLPPQRSELCAERDPHSGDRPRNQPPDPAILDDYGNGSACTQHPASQHQSGGDLLMQVNPTDIIDGHPTANADAGPLPNKSADAASTTIDNFDLKAGDALAAEGNLDEALAAYLRHKAKCQEFAKRSNPQAAKQLNQVARRIGDLAFQYLLLGHFERALECSDEALAGNPNSVILDITRAHALMFLGRVEEAEAIYRRYHGRNMAHRYTCDGYIRGDFDRLREAGFSHALMDVVEGRMFGTDETDETDELSAETAEPVVEAIEPATDEDQSKLAIARLPVEVELGDQLRAEGKLEAARESYRRGFEISSARIAEDDADLQAQRDADLAVSRMGGLAFAFLRKRKAAQALEAVEEAMSYRPSWVWLRLVYAHALMLNARITDAGNVHREYCNRTVETGGTWAESMREDFAALREAGFNLPIMEYFEQQYASKS